MNKNLMVIFASATLALVGCSDKDSADDSGSTADGTDGAGDGADGGTTAGGAVSGAMAANFIEGGAVGAAIGEWSISGVTVDCGACMFGFSGDFTAGSTGGDDFSRQVEWDASGYVYTDAGEYWGYGGGDGAGTAYWYTYDLTQPYYYYGYVSY